MQQMTLALILFVSTYILLLTLPKYRTYIVLGLALIFIASGILPLSQAFREIDWNVLLMITGTMGLVSLFIESKMPALLADLIISKAPNVKWAIVSLSLFSGVISAFVDNVATVLMVAPVALTIAKKLNMSPVSSVIAISISSNLQGAATLVGDTTSIILGGKLGMTFLDFFIYKEKIGIFFVVQISAIVATLVLLYFFRNEKQPICVNETTKVTDFLPIVLIISIIVLLIAASFIKIPNNTIDSMKNGIICIGLYVLGLVVNVIINKNLYFAIKSLKEIDYFTILILAGLFVIIGGIKEAGVVKAIGDLFGNISDNMFVLFTVIVWASVLFSAFIDNIPYVMTLIPVIEGLQFAGPVLYFGLLTGATLGGNLTPIGASANITALGILRREGHVVSSKQFMKISVPFTLAAVTTGYILLWLIWG